MTMARSLAAVDMGAESGRVVLCRWDGGAGTLEEIHRFPNRPQQVANHLVWDADHMWEEILTGLAKASAKTEGRLDSVGVDGWGVDHALLDDAGQRVGQCFCYRDGRTVPMMGKVFARIPRERIYAITGIQFFSFNTIYQLAAHVEEFRCVRLATIPLFRNMPPEAWMRTGIVSGNSFTVRAMSYVTAGHVAHHIKVLRERYF